MICTFENPTATKPRPRMSTPFFEAGNGALGAGRRTDVGVAVCTYGIALPMFDKDAVSGVRAWSPPV